MKFKIGDKYICTESKVNYWTVGKEYPVQLRTGTNPCIVDDEGTGWYPDGYEMYATFKLNEEEKEEPTTYTKTEVIRQITNAYQQFDNDSQRLAYLQGYFTK